MLPALQGQAGIELVSVRALKVVLAIAEGGRLALTVAMRPQPSRRKVLPADLDVDFDRLLNRRLSVASGVPAAAALGPYACTARPGP
jgi:hypothetical protein